MADNDVDYIDQDDSNDDESTDLALTANTIFSNNQSEFMLRNNKLCKVRPAKMKQLTLIMTFFNKIIARLDSQQLALLLDTIIRLQKEAKAKTGNVSIDPKNIDSAALIEKYLGNASLVGMLLTAVFEEMPVMAPAFTNLTIEEFEDLDMDEAALVAGAVYTVNYGFFTRSLLPILTAFLNGLAKKRLASMVKGSQKTQ
jgi:hypothetical protein